MSVTNLVIDDLRSFRVEREGSAVYARTSREGLEALDRCASVGVDNLWLDHDLGLLADGTPDTIMSVVDRLSLLAFNGSPYPVETVFIHTSNPVGRKNIKAALDRWGYRTVVVGDASEVFVVGSE